MWEDRRVIVNFIWTDPLPVVGFLLIGLVAVLIFRLHMRLQGIGEASYQSIRTLIFTIPQAYLRVASNRGWSPWLAYLVWVSAGLGIMLLGIGLARL
jgi:hypothetical protein